MVPSVVPTITPTNAPSIAPSVVPSYVPTMHPTNAPTMSPTTCAFRDSNFRVLFLGSDAYIDDGTTDNWCYRYQIIKKKQLNNFCTLNNSDTTSISVKFV